MRFSEVKAVGQSSSEEGEEIVKFRTLKGEERSGVKESKPSVFVRLLPLNLIAFLFTNRTSFVRPSFRVYQIKKKCNANKRFISETMGPCNI